MYDNVYADQRWTKSENADNASPMNEYCIKNFSEKSIW